MRATPLGIWAYKLPEKELYNNVVIDTNMVHPSKLMHDVVFLYCQAIGHLLENPTSKTRA